MATYSKEFKENLIKLMIPPANKSVKELANEYNMGVRTFSWTT